MVAAMIAATTTAVAKINQRMAQAHLCLFFVKLLCFTHFYDIISLTFSFMGEVL